MKTLLLHHPIIKSILSDWILPSFVTLYSMYCRPIMSFILKPVFSIFKPVLVAINLDSNYDYWVEQIIHTGTAASVVLGVVYLIMKISKNDTKE